MKHIFLSIAFLSGCVILYPKNSVAQDSAKNNNIIVNKDPRLDALAKKEAEFNDANMVLSGGKYVRGYRLMLLSTSDKALALKIRSKLLQNFPEQKVYMSFQPPYIKLKFGDFLDKDEADKYKTDISEATIVTGNIYIVPDLIENKQDKNKQTTSP